MAFSTLEGGYYSINGYPLRDGLRAAIETAQAAEERDREERAAPPAREPTTVEGKGELWHNARASTKQLIELIARGEHSKEQIVEACQLWLKLRG